MMSSRDEVEVASNAYASHIAECFRTGARAAAERGELEFGTRIRADLWDRVARELRADGYRVSSTWSYAVWGGDGCNYWYMKLEWGPRMSAAACRALFAFITYCVLSLTVGYYLGSCLPIEVAKHVAGVGK